MKILYCTSILFPVFLSAPPAFAASSERQIAVQGQCLKFVQLDRGSIDFYSESLNSNAQKALQEATKVFESARDSVKKMNLKDLELSTLENSVQEERVWENNKNVFKGYRARIGLKVYTSQLDRLGEVLATVSKSGIKTMGSLQTDISPLKLKDEQEACLALAIESARSKATKMAKAAGAKVGKVLTIQEEVIGSGIPGPRPIGFASKAMSGVAEMASTAPNMTIDTKSEALTVYVRVSYSLE